MVEKVVDFDASFESQSLENLHLLGQSNICVGEIRAMELVPAHTSGASEGPVTKAFGLVKNTFEPGITRFPANGSPTRSGRPTRPLAEDQAY